MKFLLRRVGFYLIAAWASLTLAFFVPRLMPGDPATALYARFHGKLKPEAIEALRKHDADLGPAAMRAAVRAVAPGGMEG